jgi:hypothetical protein
MATYANRTTVPVERSRAEVDRLLRRYGAREIATYWAEGKHALVQFTIAGRPVRLTVPMPSSAEVERDMAGRKRAPAARARAIEQLERQRWRALVLFLKAKLEAVAMGVTTFDEEFLAHILTADQSTIGDHILPELERALRSGGMPRLLPAH